MKRVLAYAIYINVREIKSKFDKPSNRVYPDSPFELAFDFAQGIFK